MRGVVRGKRATISLGIAVHNSCALLSVQVGSPICPSGRGRRLPAHHHGHDVGAGDADEARPRTLREAGDGGGDVEDMEVKGAHP